MEIAMNLLISTIQRLDATLMSENGGRSHGQTENHRGFPGNDLMLTWVLLSDCYGRLRGQKQALDLKVRVESAASQAFWRALARQPGFSFKYNNEIICPSIPAGWTTHEADLGQGKKQVMIQEPGGLEVIWQTTDYGEYQSLEYTLQFKNTSSRDLPPLTEIRSVDLAFGTSFLGEPAIHSSVGGTWKSGNRYIASRLKTTTRCSVNPRV
jgi:hypothetical protein